MSWTGLDHESSAEDNGLEEVSLDNYDFDGTLLEEDIHHIEEDDDMSI